MRTESERPQLPVDFCRGVLTGLILGEGGEPVRSGSERHRAFLGMSQAMAATREVP